MDEWKRKSLGELARFHRGITWSKDQEVNEALSGSVPVLRIPNIQEQLETDNLVWLKNIPVPAVRQYAAAKNWVLMVGSNGNPKRVGNCVLIREQNEFLFASFLVGIEPIQINEVFPEFLYRILSGPEVQRYISGDVQGSTGLTNINLGRLRLKQVSTPTLPEQRRIAEILDTLDEAIRRTEEVIEKLRRMKQGLLHDLLTRGLDANGELRDPDRHPERFKDSPLGRIPREWEVEPLGDLVRRAGGFIQTGPFGNQLHAHEYSADGVPVVMPQDILEGRLVEDAVARITPRRARTLRRHWLKENDVVISRRGDLSRCASIGKREAGWVCGTGCMLLRVEKSVLDGLWFSQVFRHDMGQRQVMSQAVGSTMINLNRGILASLRVPNPPTMERQELVGRMIAEEGRLDREIEYVEKLRTLKHGLMDDLLTGQVRVAAPEEAHV